MIEKLLYTFSKIIGNGKAWAVQNKTMRNILKSFLAINEETIYMFKKIPNQAIPSLCDDAMIPLWEDNYNIIPKKTQTIQERRDVCVSRWLGTGGQSPGYLERIMAYAGFNVKISRNISGGETYEPLIMSDGQQLIMSDGMPLLTIRRQSEPVNYFEVFGDGYAIGNGKIKLVDGEWIDPIAQPVNEKEYRAHFLVEGSDGYIFFHSVENRETFEKTLVRYKPAQTVAYVRAVLAEGKPFAFSCYNPTDETYTNNTTGLGFGRLKTEPLIMSDGQPLIMSDGQELQTIINESYGNNTESGTFVSAVITGG